MIRPLKRADLKAIRRILSESPQASQWNAEEYLHYDCIVAEAADKIMGFLVSRQTAPGEREILNLAVAVADRRKGVARALLAFELHTYQGEWFLEVRSSNREALNLYESLHFKRVAVRNNYYDTPPESAIVMRIFS